jgi:hypothetical protein
MNFAHKTPLALAALVGAVLASSCTQSAGSHNASVSQSSVAGGLGVARASVHGIPVPAEARPWPGASLSTAGGGETEAFLLPSTVSDAAIRTWYDRELPNGQAWDGLTQCTSRNAFTVVPAVIVQRNWQGSAGLLHLSVSETGSGSTIGITVEWDPARAGSGTAC